MADLQAVITQIQSTVGALTGIKAAPSKPPEKVGGPYPFVVCYPSNGTVEVTPYKIAQSIHNIVVELHVARKNLSTDYEAAIPFVEDIPRALLNDTTLGGTVDTFAGISYTFGPLGWNDSETIGWRFTLLGVKIRTSII